MYWVESWDRDRRGISWHFLYPEHHASTYKPHHHIPLLWKLMKWLLTVLDDSDVYRRGASDSLHLQYCDTRVPLATH